jgi:hypothetical protein
MNSSACSSTCASVRIESLTRWIRPDLPWVLAVPLVHAVQHRVGLMHHPGRRLGDDLQIVVGDHQREFDDAIRFRKQPRHFHVQPDERVLILCHNFPQTVP